MRTFRAHLAGLVLLALAPFASAEDWLDRAADLLTVKTPDGALRARLSGLWDLEGYSLDQPPPGLIYTDNRQLFNYRFTFFLDAQLGSHLYAFAQARVDRGFDPSEKNGVVRLDEYALRYTPWKDGRISLQLGKFGTVAGSWMPRHDSWDNPFVTAPLPYENLTSLWDSEGPASLDELRSWAHIYPDQRRESSAAVYSDKILRLPIIWGPSYASGASIFGALGKFEYAAEIKNAALSSRPEAWNLTEVGFDYPTFTSRVGFRPNPMWNFGLTGSTGCYLLPEAAPLLPPGRSLGDYRQWLLGQDITFEWHHFQLWAEFFETRFEVPGIGNADTFAYYLEAKYKITPQLFGALRWNQQLYGTMRDPAGYDAVWGRDVWRIDAALGYRFSAHTQLKLQYTLQREQFDPRAYSQLFSGQFTVKF